MTSSTSLGFAVAAFAALAGQAIAADLPSKFSTPSTPFLGSQYEWSGFYAGATADYVPSFKGTGDLAKSAASMLNPKGRGYEGSLFGGINKQYGSYVIGAEADLTMGRIDDRRSYSDQIGTANVRFHQDIAGSIRARFGYAFNNVLIFATSGVAVSQAKLTSDINIAGYSAGTTASRIYTGYTLGGGVEYGYSSSLLIRTEYRYTQYEKTSINSVKFGTDIQEVRAGLAYKF
jgi:outer membrane immunogenic protein